MTNNDKLPTRTRELELYAQGFQHVAGVDEVGRGPLVHCVVACACIVKRGAKQIPGVRDSKDVKEEEREVLYEQLTRCPDVVYSLGEVSAKRIDELDNIELATFEAMAQAVLGLKERADYVIVDGKRLPHQFKQDGKSPEFMGLQSETMVKGDRKCYAVACASLIAKVYRDRIMRQVHQLYPQYGFETNKGYGTKAHFQAIAEHGPCPYHRLSFAPFKKDKTKRKRQRSRKKSNKTTKRRKTSR